MPDSNGFPTLNTEERLKAIEDKVASIKSSLSTLSFLIWMTFLTTCSHSANQSFGFYDIKIQALESQMASQSKKLDEKLTRIESSLNSLPKDSSITKSTDAKQ